MGSLLITGSTGYIGGNLAEYYRLKRNDIRLLVRDPAKVSPQLKDTCLVLKGDITRFESYEEALDGVEAVIHSAGLLGHWGLSYRQLYGVNVEGTLHLIEAAFRAGARRFIHLSAGGVTGPVGEKPADENYLPSPKTDYEQTKWEGEKQALERAEKKDLNLLVIRPTFTYGPADPHKLNLFRAVKKGRFAFIGDGLSTVHPVYIDDLIVGVDLALQSELKGTSLIIGGPKPITKQDLIYGIADILGIRRPTIKLPIPIAEIIAGACEISARIFDFTPPLTRSRVLALSGNWGYSIKRARDELGYQPQIDLSEGLRRTVESYRELGWL